MSTKHESGRARPDYIRIEGLSKHFGDGSESVLALQDIDCSIEQGSFVTIVGPSGCGKSTLLMIVAGLIAPSTGSVQVGGSAVQRPLTDVGIVFQDDLLFDWRTVLGNVMLQAEVRGMDRRSAEHKARRLLARAGLEGFEQRRPWELSGGMRQRVSICRALLHDASVLLMDEPFGALDALTREQMNLVLQDIWSEERRTAVLVTHSISEAVFLSDRVVVMAARPGRIVRSLTIDLPRPRAMDVRDTEAFARYQHLLRDEIGYG